MYVFPPGRHGVTVGLTNDPASYIHTYICGGPTAYPSLITNVSMSDSGHC